MADSGEDGRGKRVGECTLFDCIVVTGTESSEIGRSSWNLRGATGMEWLGGMKGEQNSNRDSRGGGNDERQTERENSRTIAR
jgi:hypothetical protein